MSILPSYFESFGLDFGDNVLKTAFIKKIGSSPSLLSYNKIGLPSGALVGGIIKKDGEIIQAIKKLLADPNSKKIKTRYVHACLPEVQTFIKLINLRLDEKNEISDAIKNELPNHIPIDPQESY